MNEVWTECLREEILSLTSQIGALKRTRSGLVEKLYAEQLRKVSEDENNRMRRNMSVYYDDPEGHISESARGRQDDIVYAVKKLGIASCHDISLETGISNRSIQAAIGDLVRKERLVRLPSGPGHIKKYRLPKLSEVIKKSGKK